jgi:hypothetical protein
MEAVLLFVSLKRVALCLVALGMILGAAAAGASTYSNLETSSGWSSCGSKSCAGGGSTTSYWKKQVGSPSVDGTAEQFFVGGGNSFSNALWWRHITTNSSVSHFVLDMYQYLKNPSASQALEYAANQYYNGRWYKFSTQCSFAGGYWRVWDSYNRRWFTTGIACRRPAANSWTHLTFEDQRYNGKAVFIAITINGTKHYVNKSFSPQSTSSGSNGDIGIHYQLDGNSSMVDYSSWVDKMNFNIW